MIYISFRGEFSGFSIGLSGNAKQRRKTFREFNRSAAHKCFEIKLVRTSND